MNFITFLKKINELSEYEWSAKITGKRDYLLILVDGGDVAIEYDNNMEDGVFQLFSLGGVKGKAIDLIYAFTQSKEPLNINEEDEKIAQSLFIRTYEDPIDVAHSVLTDNLYARMGIYAD